MSQNKVSEEESKPVKFPKLTFVDSNHEQREMSVKIIPEHGWWVEEGKFWKNVEKFDINKRWRCYSKEKTDEKIVLKLRLMDHKQQQRRVDKVAKKVLDKHKEVLVASLMKTVIKGVYQNKHDIEAFVEHAKRYPNNEERDKYAYKLNLEDKIKKRKERLIKLKELIKRDKETLKEIVEEENGKQKSSQ